MKWVVSLVWQTSRYNKLMAINSLRKCERKHQTTGDIFFSLTSKLARRLNGCIGQSYHGWILL